MKDFTKFADKIFKVFFALIFIQTFYQNSSAVTIENATLDGVPIELICGDYFLNYGGVNFQCDVISDNPAAAMMTQIVPHPGSTFIRTLPPFPITYHFSYPSVSLPPMFIRFEVRDSLGIVIEVCDLTYDDPSLPVKLASFTSIVSRNTVRLNWTTTSETNNARFEIERSAVSQDWSKVGTVGGNGTVTNPTSYSFTDRNLSTGSYSYRLKQVDFNGSFEYYNLNNEVVIGAPTGFELSQNYPNPFNPSTNIEFGLPEAGNVSIKVYD
ncbi:MAG: hypothetical protein ABI462_13880, partial [Ignavibacteria bacterium]